MKEINLAKKDDKVKKISYYIERLQYLKTGCGKQTVKIIDGQILNFKLRLKNLDERN